MAEAHTGNIALVKLMTGCEELLKFWKSTFLVLILMISFVRVRNREGNEVEALM